jgi:hypothetical protein
MARRIAHGSALLPVVLVLLALAAPAQANTITTIAGGGGVTPFDYTHFESVGPFEANLPAPTGVAWSGAANGLFYFTTGNGTCVQLWYDPYTNNEPYVTIEGGTWQSCSPLTSGYASATAAKDVKLKNPCCVASDWSWDEAQQDPAVGPLVASADSGHVDFYSWHDNTGITKAGSTPPADCNDANLIPVGTEWVANPNPPPAQTLALKDPPVAPRNADFCNVSALARQFQNPHYYALAERNRGPYGAILYVIDPSVPSVRPILWGQLGINSIGGLAYTNSNRLIVSDGASSIWQFIPNGGGYIVALVAGQQGAAPAFSGDGGTGPNARFAKPTGLAVGFDSSLYIADTDNCRIRKLSLIGSLSATMSTVAGNGCNAGAPLGDGGSATAANLDHPVGVAMSPIGLLVTDTGHNRIRLIDRTTIVDPPTFTADNTPTFDIRSLDEPPNSHIKCKVDNVEVACSGIGPLSDDAHSLQAWEDGDHGITPYPPDPTPAVANFTVDTTPPTGVGLVSPEADAGGVAVDTDFRWTGGSDAHAGIDHYELWIDGAKNRDIPTSACTDGTCVAKAAQALAEGNHTWQIRTADAVGNTAATDTRTLNAGGSPKAAFTISPNPALVGRSVTFDGGTSSDESGIARYEWDLDGDGSFERDAGPNPVTTRSYAAPATVPIALRITDGTGHTSTAAASLKVTDPTGSQSLLGVTINNGAQFTRTPDVTLNVKAPATANALLVSNDGGFLAPSTFPSSATIKWKLDSSGPERLPKTVYLRFVLGPIISTNYTDDIILDEIPPVVQSAALVPVPAPSRAAARSAKARAYTVKVKAKDSNSGVGKLQVTVNKRKPGKLLKYKSKLKVKSATRPRFLRAQDKAGNFSAWKKLR